MTPAATPVGSLPRYVLITPAHNEEAFIELTIKSVIAQTHRPHRWIVVNDGSTDGTEKIIRAYAAKHAWMEVVTRPVRSERHFAGKVDAFNAGYQLARETDCEIIGNLDADLSFDADLFELLMQKFVANPQLGVAGPPFSEGRGTYDFRYSSIEHVSGACQVFRRKCFEDIGGYRPMKGGGIDVVAVLMARMKGWQTRTFTDRACEHHRLMGSATSSSLTVSYRLGRKDYMLGRHPLWQAFRSAYQIRQRPFLLGGCALFAGYFAAWLRGDQRPVPPELVAFQRRDQMRRLGAFFRRIIGLGYHPSV